MPCVVNQECSEDPALVMSLQTHGVTIGLCRVHMDKAHQLISGLALDNMVDDYIRLQTVMLANDLFFSLMKDFTNEVSRAAKSRAGVSTWFNRAMIPMSLNRALWRYEQMCRFGEQKKIMSGLLSFEEFKSSITSGYMVKDPGPGPDHGEFSHRLQWQYIMRIITNKFSVAKAPGWDFSPLELYCGMFKKGNVWGALLEGQRLSLGSCPGSPNWVNKRFRGDGELAGTSFGTALAARYNKRQSLIDSLKHSLEQKYPELEIDVWEGRPEIPTRPNRLDIHKVIEYLYNWKKAGRPAIKPTINEPLEWKKALKQRTLDVAWELWNDNPERFQSSRSAPQYRRAALDDDTGAAVSNGLLLHRSESVTDQPLEERLHQSRISLNERFSYSKSTGARQL